MECAWAATHSKQADQAYLRNKFFSLAARIGHKKALLAIGHKILCAIYHILKNGQPYQAPDLEKIQQKLQEKQVSRYLEKIKHLGYEVQLTTVTS